MPEPHEQLDAAMNARRLALRLRWSDVAEGAGVTYEALRAIRRGDSKPTELTARAIDAALQWVPGSVYAVLAGGQPTPIEALGEASDGTDESLFPAREALRRMVRASARELGMTPDDVDEAMRLARQDLERERPDDAHPPAAPRDAQERSILDRAADEVAPEGYGRDLSDMLRARRLESGMSLRDVAAAAVDPGTGNRVVEADWLDRLERAELGQGETPQYPQLDALTEALHLDPAEVQEAAGRQFMGVDTLWSEDGEVQGIALGPVSDEARKKLLRLMNTYRPVPKDGRK
ncbi:helix-turn-helix transcriptional regulator [Streptomyces sp. NPDC050988]|uniref:helix-turn-helix transcriptional regulator n=1 Tax=Streptomyces sp. NPDC050988 TaxID=3365637 RepID=UPI003791B33F